MDEICKLVIDMKVSRVMVEYKLVATMSDLRVLSMTSCSYDENLQLKSKLCQ